MSSGDKRSSGLDRAHTGENSPGGLTCLHQPWDVVPPHTRGSCGLGQWLQAKASQLAGGMAGVTPISPGHRRLRRSPVSTVSRCRACVSTLPREERQYPPHVILTAPPPQEGPTPDRSEAGPHQLRARVLRREHRRLRRWKSQGPTGPAPRQGSALLWVSHPFAAGPLQGAWPGPAARCLSWGGREAHPVLSEAESVGTAGSLHTDVGRCVHLPSSWQRPGSCRTPGTVLRQ